MVSRENTVIAVCIALAIASLYVANSLTTLQQWQSAALILGVGVLVPTLVNEFLDGRAGDER
ncbi:hypothetical protein SY89_00313 [Halolamina pelagica]|uniref:Uncharacterized protein n=1 Tax=Halolamina pelagica TaxID=699431 RepID=A0A0P7HSF6_9EURY|nr:hypothetical protein [Halolamina pelagica]KPN29599.1 hypothetical protein SY89_00313 [Halolamina pelagica]